MIASLTGDFGGTYIRLDQIAALSVENRPNRTRRIRVVLLSGESITLESVNVAAADTLLEGFQRLHDLPVQT